MKKIKIAEISIAIALIISISISAIDFSNGCKEIRNDVVRLHILANSDSEADQAVKLKVRDELLKSGEQMFSGELNPENAKYIIENNKENLIKIVNKVLRENGFEYNSFVYLTNEYFETREYDGFTMPAGKYTALKIILGKGEGHNWWCVMFPPLCLPAATKETNLDAVFSENGVDILTGGKKYKIKFKILEIFENAKAYISAN